MRASLLAFCFSCAVLFDEVGLQTACAADQSGSGSTIIVLDASGSMDERIKGESKMSIAKRAVRELVESLPDGVELGLVVYSHRKQNDCDDIELLIPPGPLDKTAFVATVDAIKPNGRTPISDAIEFAAKALDYENAPANVILVSDGVETCRKDPCATVARLAATGTNLVVHAVAFDLSAREAKTFECLASATGGRFLQARDAGSLQDALQLAVLESTTPLEAAAPPVENLSPATLDVPGMVAIGADFPVVWTGPDNAGDYITIVPVKAPEDSYSSLGYTRQGSPLELTALMDVGPAEVRYIAGHSRVVLGRATIEITPVETTLSSVDEAVAGSEVGISWQGPGNDGDFITIVPAGAGDRVEGRYAYTRQGTTVRVSVPVDPGDCEIRYVSGQDHRVLARRSIKVVAAEVTLGAVAEVIAGAPVSISWTGPNNTGDYLTVVTAGTPDGRYMHYAYTSAGSTVSVNAPMEPGQAEIRYMTGQGAKVLARRPITIVGAEVTLDGPIEAIAGSPVAIGWAGPNNSGDYLTIVAANAPDNSYKHYNYTSSGSPTSVNAPIEPGDCEIRYIAGQGGKVLARRPIRVIAAEISLEVPSSVAVGMTFTVQWSGPNLGGDYLTIVKSGAADGVYGSYSNTSAGTPATLTAPKEAGTCEVRYVNGATRKVLKSVPIEVTP